MISNKIEKEVERVRKLCGDADTQRDAGLTTPDNIMRYDDIVYGSDTAWQVLDVYRPKDKANEKLPVIVSIHGGAFVYGDKGRYQFYCMSLAQRGFAVVNFTYRLAPEYPFPAPIEDTNRVFLWMLANADQYGLDTNHIYGVGDSAGAINLAIYSAICTNADYAEQFDFEVPKECMLKAVALNCGGYDFVDSHLDEGGKTMLSIYLGGEVSQDKLKRVSPAYYVTEKFPPTFLMTAIQDFMRPEAPAMAKKLFEMNVPFAWRVYGDASNQLQHVFHCDVQSKDARVCNDEECAFFRAYW